MLKWTSAFIAGAGPLACRDASRPRWADRGTRIDRGPRRLRPLFEIRFAGRPPGPGHPGRCGPDPAGPSRPDAAHPGRLDARRRHHGNARPSGAESTNTDLSLPRAEREGGGGEPTEAAGRGRAGRPRPTRPSS